MNDDKINKHMHWYDSRRGSASILEIEQGKVTFYVDGNIAAKKTMAVSAFLLSYSPMFAGK